MKEYRHAKAFELHEIDNLLQTWAKRVFKRNIDIACIPVDDYVAVKFKGLQPMDVRKIEAIKTLFDEYAEIPMDIVEKRAAKNSEWTMFPGISETLIDFVLHAANHDPETKTLLIHDEEGNPSMLMLSE